MAEITSLLWVTWDHTVLAAVTFPPLPPPKLALNSATRVGCKAELAWVSSLTVNGDNSDVV